jgi:lipoprotein-anchoring transpeptidase ErfK/SrfK
MDRRRLAFAAAGAAAVVCLMAFSPGRAFATVPPGPSVLTSPADGVSASYATLRLTAGSATSSMTVLIDGVPVGSRDCTSGEALTFGRVAMHAGVTSIVAIASDGVSTCTYEFRVRRIEHAWATCIIIDKSDFRLYWIRNDELVKAYPIAIGKRRSQTPNAIWKVGRKERTPPKSVYGPRKLRLFRRSSYRTRRHRVAYRYRYTAYGIHGTNQPWVIGTQASHGCIRLTNAEIRDLWPQVPVGTMVQTRQ